MNQFGKYQMLRRVGSGGMAEVYLASITVAQGLKKQLVIKKIHPAHARSAQFVTMFVDEAKIALSLNHPNIVQVFDFGQVGQTYFLAMEYIEGLDVLKVLQDTSKKGKGIPLPIAAYIVQQVAKGLDYAHRKTNDYGEALDIVHRDISPQNVLLSWDGAVKIVDFGIARAKDIKEDEGVVKGKYAYMPPEQARGKLVDRRADVFAAGILLFELCCKRPLFMGKGKEVLAQAKAGAIPSPRKLNPDIPKELEATILKALTYNPDQRFQTGRDLQNALGQFQFQWAQKHGGFPADSGTLAQWLARNITKNGVSVQIASGTATQHRMKNGSDGVTIDHIFDTSDTIDGTKPSSPKRNPRKPLRERKAVFLLYGHLSAPIKNGTNSVGEDFRKISKDIAFKHQAHLEFLKNTNSQGIRITIGVPAAQDDDASRTTKLALALIEALKVVEQEQKSKQTLSIGIVRGVAIVSRDESGRYTHTLEGTMADTAATLAKRGGGGETFVTVEFQRAAQSDWNFEEVKSTGEQRVFKLTGKKERMQRLRELSQDVNIIGRDLELKALQDAYRETLIHGAHQLYVISGEPGMGKRSLINALLASIPKGEASVMRASARAATRYIPFGIIADFGRDAMGLAENSDPKEIQKRIEMLGELLWPNQKDSVEIGALIDAACLMFGVQRDGCPELAQDQIRSRMRQILLRLEQKFTPDKPLIVVAENVHWADEQTIALTHELLQVNNTRGVLVLLTAREEPIVHRLLQENRASCIGIGELDLRFSRELIERRFAAGENVDALIEQILPHTGGNPFFIQEVIETLVENGTLRSNPPGSLEEGLLHWTSRGATITIPSTVESLIATRIDQLDVSQKQTIFHAAVLGSRFKRRVLSALVDHDLDKTLPQLVKRGLLRKDTKGFSFSNDMTATVAYRMIPEEDRQELHRQCATNFKNRDWYAPDKDGAYVARHLELAGDHCEAAETYLLAASHAMHVGSLGDAMYQLTKAMNLFSASAHEEQFKIRLKRQEILGRQAKRSQQQAEINKLLEEAKHLGRPAPLGLAYACLAKYNTDTGNLGDANAAIESSLKYALMSKEPLIEAEAHRQESIILHCQGENDKALHKNNLALQIVNQHPTELSTRAQILNSRGLILWNMNRLTEAIESYAETLVIYENLRQPRSEARSYNNIGIVFSTLGESEEALSHYKQSLRIDQQLGDRSQIALKLGNIGQTYAELGDSARGTKYLTKALRLCEARQDHTSMVDIVNSLGQSLLNQGQYPQAQKLLERGLRLAKLCNNTYQKARSLIYLSIVKTNQGMNLDEAKKLAIDATTLAEKATMPTETMKGYYAQALACLKNNDFQQGLLLSHKALESLRKVGQGEGLETILHVHAQLCEKCNRTQEALESINRSKEIITTKAAKIKDAELRESYLNSMPVLEALEFYRQVVT